MVRMEYNRILIKQMDFSTTAFFSFLPQILFAPVTSAYSTLVNTSNNRVSSN